MESRTQLILLGLDRGDPCKAPPVGISPVIDVNSLQENAEAQKYITLAYGVQECSALVIARTFGF